MSRVGRRIAHAIAGVVALCAACSTTRPRPEPFAGEPVRTASREQLVARLREDAAAIAALQGRVALRFGQAAGAGERSCRGALAARNPFIGGASPGLYVQGYAKLLPTLFTLVSDGRRFWLHVPRENVVYTGAVERRRDRGPRGDVRLDARDLFRALFLEPLDPLETVEVKEEPSRYVLSARRGGRLRTLWLERRRFAVVREAFHGADGREELVVERDAWTEVAGRLYPGRIRLRDGASGSAVLLEFERLTLDPSLGAETFVPRLPPHVRVERLPDGEGES